MHKSQSKRPVSPWIKCLQPVASWSQPRRLCTPHWVRTDVRASTLRLFLLTAARTKTAVCNPPHHVCAMCKTTYMHSKSQMSGALSKNDPRPGPHTCHKQHCECRATQCPTEHSDWLPLSADMQLLMSKHPLSTRQRCSTSLPLCLQLLEPIDQF